MISHYSIEEESRYPTRRSRLRFIMVVILVTLAPIVIGGYFIYKAIAGNLPEGLENPTNLQFSPDYKIMASDTLSLGITLWDMSNKKKIDDLGASSLGSQLVFAPDGKTFAWSNVDYALFYNLKQNRMFGTPAKAAGWIYAMAVSPAPSIASTTNVLATGGRVGAGGTASVELWNMMNADSAHYTVANIQGGADVWSLGFSGDGKLLAAGLSDGSVRVWQISTNRLEYEFQASQVVSATTSGASIDDIAISPNNQVIAAGNSDGTIALLSVQDEHILRTITVPSTIEHIAFSPDSKYLVIGEEPTNEHSKISLWNISDGTRIWSSDTHTVASVYGPHANSITDIRFSADSKRLTAGFYDGIVQSYDLP